MYWRVAGQTDANCPSVVNVINGFVRGALNKTRKKIRLSTGRYERARAGVTTGDSPRDVFLGIPLGRCVRRPTTSLPCTAGRDTCLSSPAVYYPILSGTSQLAAIYGRTVDRVKRCFYCTVVHLLAETYTHNTVEGGWRICRAASECKKTKIPTRRR